MLAISSVSTVHIRYCNHQVETAKEEAWNEWDSSTNEDEDLDGDGLPDLKSSVEARRLQLEEEKNKALEEDPLAMFKGKDGMFPDWFGMDEEVQLQAKHEKNTK